MNRKKQWHELSPITQLRLVRIKDPRVPPDTPLLETYRPRPPRGFTSNPIPTVRLEDFSAVSEEDMWLLLQLSWEMQKIKPPKVRFLVNGHALEVPIPWKKLPSTSVKKISINGKPIPKPNRVQLPLTNVCEHCHRAVTARSYKAFHGPKCFRAPMKLKTTEVKPLRERLLTEQGGRCALCGQLIDEGKAVLDHDHATGHCRGVLHRSCNSVLGKWERGRRYGKDFDPVHAAKGLFAYLTKPQTHPIHPAHGKPKRRKK